MRNRNWLLCSAAGLALAAAALADSRTTTPKATEPPDPPGTTLYMDQLRALFAAWDLNGDNYLDKSELARAFRGPDAKPYDDKQAVNDKAATADASTDSQAVKKPDYSRFPDYEFLVQLDQDGDGQISRSEFLGWARDYAVQLKQKVDQETKVAGLEAKLQSASSPKEVKKLEKELKKEQASLAKMSKEAGKAATAAEKAIRQQMKHEK